MTAEKVRAGKVRVENVNHPGRAANVDADKYHAARAALLAVLPAAPPGLTQAGMLSAVGEELAADAPHLFPGGAKAGWWAKTVQLDLEAKGVLARDAGKPLRWRRAG